jgi:citrate synthase
MSDAWLNASEAAKRLKISTQTLYAYVSRGLLHSERVEGSPGKRYRRSDVEKLVARQGTSRNPKGAAQASLNWGLPVLKSALTTVQDGHLYYQGRDAVSLAQTMTLEALAASMWGCDAEELLTAAIIEPSITQLRALGLSEVKPRPQRSLNAFMVLVAQNMTQPAEQAPLARQGTQLLALMRAASTLRSCPNAARKQAMHVQLQNIWHLNHSQGELIRAALVLCADHELNVSSFTTRCVASSGARLDACVIAGLAALSGTRHGGITSIIEDHWERWMSLSTTNQSRRERLSEWLENPGDGTAPLRLGFGHPLYSNGDPRASAILAGLAPDSRRERLIKQVYASTGLRPSLDFALVALRRQLDLPEGSAFALFAIGRVVGWIAHAVEQGTQGNLIRPRADYVGPRPTGPLTTQPEAPRQSRELSAKKSDKGRLIRFR